MLSTGGATLSDEVAAPSAGSASAAAGSFTAPGEGAAGGSSVHLGANMSGLPESASRPTWAMSSFGASSAAEVVLSEAGSSAPVEGLVTRFRLLMTAQLNRLWRPQTSLRNAPRSAHHLEHRVDRAVAAADLQRSFDRAGDELFGQHD